MNTAMVCQPQILCHSYRKKKKKSPDYTSIATDAIDYGKTGGLWRKCMFVTCFKPVIFRI